MYVRCKGRMDKSTYVTDKCTYGKYTQGVNPRPAGGPGFPRPAGGVFEHPPSNSAPGPRSDTGKTAFERASKIRKKSL